MHHSLKEIKLKCNKKFIVDFDEDKLSSDKGISPLLRNRRDFEETSALDTETESIYKIVDGKAVERER